ncbi:DUF2569 family protein [Bacillus niameyensis]|uniref:DUF2569 family protein n=1 Tax=Bacillus niameyensis TaxID=1522308 RepID=UPI0007812B18|nr:DUF2569 family protein [Bacillus niameyensis]
MNGKTNNNHPKIETDFRYAIVAGWLILPALMILFNLFMVLYVVFTFNPADLGGYDLFIYITDLVLTLFYLFIIYTWVKRKQILPKLMIANFTIEVLLQLAVIFVGAKINWIYLLISAIWIAYFITSKRAKATFIH